MRDKLKFKDEEYFNAYIEKEKARIAKFLNWIETGKTPEERIPAIKGEILWTKTKTVIAKYSRGDDLSTIKDEYTEVFKEWLPLFSTESYNELLRMISLGILFNIDAELLDKASELTAQAGFKDWLISFLLQGRKDSDKISTEKFLFKKKYLPPLKSFVENKNIDDMKLYLSKWYNADCGYYGAHKSTEKLYCGYWSFEAGAVAKILGIDDEEIKDKKYYPYDLVHFKG